MRPRIEQELTALVQFYPNLVHLERAEQDWFLLPAYSLPSGWRVGDTEISETRVCFLIGAGYPVAEPYGFLVPSGINFEGTPPTNTASSDAPPFPGPWCQFSWAPDGWAPNADVQKGSNLVVWVRSFANRFREGI
jgi:hypothetical protein